MKLYPYNMGSKSAKALAQALGIKRIKHDGAGIAIKGTLINWGSSSFSNRVGFVVGKHQILNHPNAVKKASNKLETFKALEGVCSVPEWTEGQEEAIGWLQNGITAVARTKLNGHSGEGIIIVTPDEYNNNVDLPDAPLYTKYIPKTLEYRLHVFQGEVFFTQRKARKKEVPDEEINWKIRNHANGFVFAHNEGVDLGEGANQLAILAVNTLGLNFGAVDIIYNAKRDKYYVLEVNSAPGLEGETLNKYVEQFRKYL